VGKGCLRPYKQKFQAKQTCGGNLSSEKQTIIAEPRKGKGREEKMQTATIKEGGAKGDRGSGEHIKELNNEKEKIMHIKIE
jgi:hypothetical protein